MAEQVGVAVEDVRERWSVEGSEDLYRSGLPFALRADSVRRDAGEEEAFTRVVLEHPGAVVVLAVDDSERVLTLRQYRHPVGLRMVELPAGLLDVEGEDPQAAAARELLEEAGLEAAHWQPLVSAYSSPGISSEQIHYFLARGLTAGDRGDFRPAHEEADMTLAWVPYAELVAACLDGRVQDAPVLIAVLAAQHRGLVGNGAAGD